MTWLTAHIFPMITMAAYLAAAIRLIAFRRQGFNRKPLYAMVASALVGLMLCAVLEILLFRPAVGPAQCAVALVYAVAALRSKGNVAAMLRGGR